MPTAPPKAAQHVEQSGRRARQFPGKPHRGNPRERCDDKSLADGPDDVGRYELVAAIIEAEMRIHETTRREDRQADTNDRARIEMLLQQGQEGDDQQLRQANPGQYQPRLFGVVALY